MRFEKLALEVTSVLKNFDHKKLLQPGRDSLGSELMVLPQESCNFSFTEKKRWTFDFLEVSWC